ncbi:MAG: helix-turn-helix domain-containing protein [Candidatus Pacearchaeota archaeon]|nr:helix-turn-helix domain-containing protein [Candidatus Pacearchaeota archaeon]
MIINQELVRKVKEHFNLNIYETKVWLALLSKGVVSAGETAELSGVPRSRTYDVLESLAKRGFAIIKVGKPVKYIAVEPKTVLERMKTNTLTEAQEKVDRLSVLKDTPEYDELVQLHKNGVIPIRIEDLSGHIKGRANLLSKIKELVLKTEKEIIIHTSIDDIEGKSRVILPVLSKLNQENIKVRLSLSGDSYRIKRFASRNDLKVKESTHSGRFFIVDRKEILFMIHQDNADEEIGVWINSPYFANAFSGMFDKQIRS